ncbi:MAG: hypothetical protein CSA60_04510 [Neptuniibacter caesariensis]|uniref:GTP-binding protein n=1 Tax=Neptuniibacter caesariensis TaxID=207954 RepID=A0A2G6JIZ1_NEPCE|nr:MAG: hypothetical protein CSA60_04510 [Neptuniibacter caesariensis]
MTDYKVLFTGSVSSGKTTAVKSLSSIETIDTDASASDSVIRRKEKTTIAMDYGVLNLSDNAKLHLYGTPGQERFKFMWQLMMSDIVHDAEALILLVDNTRKDPFKDIRFYVEEFRDFIIRRRLIIAVTHSDIKANPDYKAYMQDLKAMGLYATVVFIDARDPSSVLKLVKELVGDYEPDIDWAALEEEIAPNSTLPTNIVSEVEEETAKVSLLEATLHTRGVKGAIHLDANRKILAAQMPDTHSQELMESLVNLVAVIEKKAAFLGQIDDLVLCGPEQESLSVFVDNEQALGICSDKQLSLNVVKQQAADLLQWSHL